MKVRKATAKYEAWLGRYLTLLPADLKLKHEAMRAAKFPFLRATYYRWAQIFPEVCGKLDSAVKVLGVGDLARGELRNLARRRRPAGLGN